MRYCSLESVTRGTNPRAGVNEGDKDYEAFHFGQSAGDVGVRYRPGSLLDLLSLKGPPKGGPFAFSRGWRALGALFYCLRFREIGGGVHLVWAGAASIR